MTDDPNFADEDVAWRRCEVAWGTWLQQGGHAVTHLNRAVDNHPRTHAPMITLGGRDLRLPDLMTTSGGTSSYWEVKYRTRSEVNALTGVREHWMAYDVFQDYLEVAEGTGVELLVILYEAASSTSPGRWMQAAVQTLLQAGREDLRFGRGGEQLLAWVWPAEAMSVVRGPRVDVPAGRDPVLPEEGTETSLAEAVLRPVERRIRKAGMPSPPGTVAAPEALAEQALLADPFAALDVLRRSLGIPSLPRYSVLRAGTDHVDLTSLLGLLDYGIRVFLVSGPLTQPPEASAGLEAFRQSRLLEWAVLDHEPDDLWVVDGHPADPAAAASLAAVLAAADAEGGINGQQYQVVHADPGRDVVVTAGAGTGKTETMAERLLFLLSTVGGGGATGDEADLKVEEISLVTFTRDAAREMRARLARTLMLRRRLCRSSVQPLAWLLQLSTAEIVTIHALATRVIQEGGGPTGLSPSFRVARMTMPFRALVYEALSDSLAELLERQPPDSVPAAHLWLEHVTQVWEALANNGVDLLQIGATDEGGVGVDWGTPPTDALGAAVWAMTTRTVETVAAAFRELCLQNDSLPTGHLVSSALAALTAPGSQAVRRPRHLFVDEFQDTDALQMHLLLTLSDHPDARLFVVGDPKQGIYRFRGAEGNAFVELDSTLAATGRPDLLPFPLTRNFRSGEKLLSSLHPLFATWGKQDLLPYRSSDALRPDPLRPDHGHELQAMIVSSPTYQQSAAATVLRWREESPGASIAILCRFNRHALAVQQAVQQAGGICDLRVGGHFFTTEAVREMRVFLDAVVDPGDDAALLELAETRWSGGILAGRRHGAVDPADLPLWETALAPPASWTARLTGAAQGGSFPAADLEPLRDRAHSLRAAAERVPVMQWLVECVAAFAPQACERTGTLDDEGYRCSYGRCLDHLVTLLDGQFADASVSLDRVLSWLRLQIATNVTEDEPTDPDDAPGSTTALTVHKAKGREFDLVYVPHTWTPFGPPPSVKTRASVLKQGDGPPRLAWQWTERLTYSNVATAEHHLWQADDAETLREETRLLYVALTRAKSRAVVAMTRRTPGGGGPATWQDLLLLGGLRP